MPRWGFLIADALLLVVCLPVSERVEVFGNQVLVHESRAEIGLNSFTTPLYESKRVHGMRKPRFHRLVTTIKETANHVQRRCCSARCASPTVKLS